MNGVSFWTAALAAERRFPDYETIRFWPSARPGGLLIFCTWGEGEGPQDPRVFVVRYRGARHHPASGFKYVFSFAGQEAQFALEQLDHALIVTPPGNPLHGLVGFFLEHYLFWSSINDDTRKWRWRQRRQIDSARELRELYAERYPAWREWREVLATRLICRRAKAAAADPRTELGRRVLLRRAGFDPLLSPSLQFVSFDV